MVTTLELSLLEDMALLVREELGTFWELCPPDESDPYAIRIPFDEGTVVLRLSVEDEDEGTCC